MSTFFHHVCGRVCFATIVGLLGALAIPAAVQATAITVPNYSFEGDAVPADPGYTSTVPTGWHGDGSLGTMTNGANGNTAFSNVTGNQFAWVNVYTLSGGAQDRGSMRLGDNSDLGTLQAGLSYTVSADIGRLSTAPGISGDSLNFKLSYQDSSNVWHDLDAPAINYDNTSTSMLTTFTATSAVVDSSADGKTLWIWAYPNYGSSSIVDSCTWAIDNVRVSNSAATPEPGTLSILVTGLFGLLAYAWRKRR